MSTSNNESSVTIMSQSEAISRENVCNTPDISRRGSNMTTFSIVDYGSLRESDQISTISSRCPRDVHVSSIELVINK